MKTISFSYLLPINLTILFFNVVLGLIMHVLIYSSHTPDTHGNFVSLPDIAIRKPNEAKDILMLYKSTNNNVYENYCHNTDKSPSLHLDINHGLFDRSFNYMIHYFAVLPTMVNITDIWHICLSTQTSVNLLFWIAEQVEMWEGPMSVSVFTPNVDYTIAIKMIQYLQTCFPKVRDRVAFHFSYPKTLPPKYEPMQGGTKEYDCSQPESVNTELVNQIRTPKLKDFMKKAAYPQNMMRNVAREGCQSKYSFTPDIDMIPVFHMSRRLNEFLSQNSTRICHKCAFVIPVYEIHSRVKNNPLNKDELMKLIQKKLAQRFHVKVYPPNQSNSNLKEWEKYKSRSKLEILYNITKWKEGWEPIYAAESSVPFYDERFVGYGHTRSSQVYEMHEAGYSFFMLNDAFLCHQKFQSRSMRSKYRNKQMSKNNKKYQVFLSEMSAKYKDKKTIKKS